MSDGNGAGLLATGLAGRPAYEGLMRAEDDGIAVLAGDVAPTEGDGEVAADGLAEVWGTDAQPVRVTSSRAIPVTRMPRGRR
jgi:hypothetical protein